MLHELHNIWNIKIESFQFMAFWFFFFYSFEYVPTSETSNVRWKQTRTNEQVSLVSRVPTWELLHDIEATSTCLTYHSALHPGGSCCVGEAILRFRWESTEFTKRRYYDLTVLILKDRVVLRMPARHHKCCVYGIVKTRTTEIGDVDELDKTWRTIGGRVRCARWWRV